MDEEHQRVVEALTRLGGVAGRADLLEHISRRRLAAAVAAGAVLHASRDTYALLAVDESRRAAAGLNGVVSHVSAALLHGWAVKEVPPRPQVTLRRSRVVSPDRLRGVRVMRSDLPSDDHIDGVTRPDRTLVDCLRSEPFDSALAIADSALRSGFDHARLVALCRIARGPGAIRMRAIAEQASGLAANPFESVTRAISLEVTELRFRPQVPIYGPHFLGCPDLVDDELGIVGEADSFEWHGKRKQLRADARRYDELSSRGWLVLRFAWEDVMHDQGWVAAVLRRAVRTRLSTKVPRTG